MKCMEDAQNMLPLVEEGVKQRTPVDPKISLPGKPANHNKDKFYNVPTSPATNLIMETLVTGQSITDIPKNKKKISRGASYTIQKQTNSNKHQITMATKKTHVTIELADLDKLTAKNNSPAKKLFVFSLIKANEKGIFEGQLEKNEISFDLKELVDIGFYGTIQGARKGFKAGMDTLTSLKIQGSMTEGNATRKIERLEILFTGAEIKGGRCKIYFNGRIDWSFITRYFTILPRYYFKLPNKSSDLLYYIFFLARQHTQDIKELGYFNISFRAIQGRLHLPREDDENATKNPKRDIQDPIETAIKELQNEHISQYGQSTEFQIVPCYEKGVGITKFLDEGYLKIILKDNFATPFIDIADSVTKRVNEAKVKRKNYLKSAETKG